MERLDANLLEHAKKICTEDSPRIVDVYWLQGQAEMHCYLKTAHQFDPAEVDALLQFADPLEVACFCGEMNTHEYSFPICDLLQKINAKEIFAPAEQPQRRSLREQIRAAAKEARQHPAPKERSKDGEAR